MDSKHDISRCAAEPAFRFCWLRENLPNHVEHDSGFRIARRELLIALLGLHPAQQHGVHHGRLTLEQVECGKLPDWALRKLGVLTEPMRAVIRDWSSIASQIRETAVGIAGEAELHLPYVDRRKWPQRSSYVRRTELGVRGSTIMPANLLGDASERHEYWARLLGATAVTGTAAIPLRCWFDKRMRGPWLPALVPPGFKRIPSRTPADVRVNFTLEPEACSAWVRTPAEQSRRYYAIHSRVSLAVQRAMREWIAFDWFDDLQKTEEVVDAYTMLAYAAATPYLRKSGTEFTYDTMDPDWLRAVFLHSRTGLRAALHAVREALLADGRLRLAREYYPAQSKYVIDRVKRQRRGLHQLVEAEGDIVNRLLRMGLELRGEDSPRRAAVAASACALKINTLLRHCVRDQDCTAIGPILLFEATNALHEALGGRRALKVDARIERRRAALAARCA